MLKPAVLTVLGLAATFAAPATARAGDFEFDIGFGRRRIRHVRIVRRPAPVRHVHRHDACCGHVHVHSRSCRFVPGHYAVRIESVWEPGFHRIEDRPAVYEQRVDEETGEVEEVLVRPARRVRVWVEGRHVDRKVRVWRPGRWTCVY